MYRLSLLLLFIGICLVPGYSQEENLTGVELAFDSDSFADGIRESDEVADRNYTTALRLGIYGAWAEKDYLGLPLSLIHI